MKIKRRGFEKTEKDRRYVDTSKNQNSGIKKEGSSYCQEDKGYCFFFKTQGSIDITILHVVRPNYFVNVIFCGRSKVDH